MQTISGVSVTSMQQHGSRCVMILSGAVPAVNELKVIITAGYVISAFSLSFFFQSIYLSATHSDSKPFRCPLKS